MKKIGILMASLLISILLMQFVWHIPKMQKTKETFSAEKINLVLRRTGHRLLQQAGDSISQIPPIKQIKENVWQLRLEKHFNYDSLPVFLQNALEIHQIHCNYDVMILNCETGTLVLGYNYWDISPKKKVPCQGRYLPKTCYDIQFTVLPQANKATDFPLTGWLMSGIMGLLLYAVGKKYLPKKPTPQAAIVPETEVKSEAISFANSCLDVANQLLVCGKVSHKLTFREAKLLHLFVQQRNQVLERSFILDNVWADEGVVVGRSIDMFVSRLRKMLRDDPDVQLVAIHGVGYKMEIVIV